MRWIFDSEMDEIAGSHPRGMPQIVPIVGTSPAAHLFSLIHTEKVTMK